MDDSLRQLAAAGSILLYGTLCAATWRRERRRARAQADDAAALAGVGAPVLVLHASQTGQAETIAWQTARWLHARGAAVQVRSLNEIDLAALQTAERALFVTSTYGEGDPPDGASAFVERVMGAQAQLSHLRYALLALGDRQYAHFCGFGRRLDAWLRDSGAVAAHERIDVDNGDEAALARWRGQWDPEGADAGADAEAGAAAAEAFQPWRLVAREALNPGSAGAPIFHLALAPAAGELPAWAAGDLVQVAVAGDPQRPRDYSIASIPADGEVQLLVRQERHADGTLGAASGLLTATLPLGHTVALRLRPHPAFRQNGNSDRPLVLIGNGTGLAGLRGHLRERIARGRCDNWLVFGERSARHDFLYRAELEAWLAAGRLARLDMVFSRDEATQHGGRRYVQDRLLQVADELRVWVERGAAIYVCGSLQGMAGSVDAALRQVIGAHRLHEMNAAGRYRRDVY